MREEERSRQGEVVERKISKKKIESGEGKEKGDTEKQRETRQRRSQG